MNWVDFQADTAMEVAVLERALPLVPTESEGASRATIDMAVDSPRKRLIRKAVGGTLGLTPSECVKELQIRPLLFVAAWKVLDMMLETALDQSGKHPGAKRRWTIDEKTKRAGQLAPPSQFAPLTWEALMRSYVGTVELRHSLVHRNVHVDANDRLIGRTQAGRSLRPLTAIEQEAFVRAVLRAVMLVTASVQDDRVAADLVRQLGTLSGLHGKQLASVTLHDSLPEITVIIDADKASPSLYTLDVPGLWARIPFNEVEYVDLIVTFRDRPDQRLRGRLEQAPLQVHMIDPDKPPSWLTS